MVSRDLDSLISAREAAAVKAWLASDKVKNKFTTTLRIGCPLMMSQDFG